jgi:hypothetical protein
MSSSLASTNALNLLSPCPQLLDLLLGLLALLLGLALSELKARHLPLQVLVLFLQLIFQPLRQCQVHLEPAILCLYFSILILDLSADKRHKLLVLCKLIRSASRVWECRKSSTYAVIVFAFLCRPCQMSAIVFNLESKRLTCAYPLFFDLRCLYFVFDLVVLFVYVAFLSSGHLGLDISISVQDYSSLVLLDLCDTRAHNIERGQVCVGELDVLDASLRQKVVEHEHTKTSGSVLGIATLQVNSVKRVQQMDIQNRLLRNDSVVASAIMHFSFGNRC